MKLGEGFIEVRADRKPFDGDLRDLAGQIRGGQGGAGEVQAALRDALVGGAFLVGSKKAIDAASNLQQAVGGTEAVFGEAKDAVEDFARGAAESAGLSERAARELTSTIGGLLKGFGFTNDEAADLSVTLAKLGADLAATFGGTPEEAVQALAAALRGETDPLERFGIALNQTLVNAKAVELGLAATTSSVDQHAKAQATLALITERSADAQGRFHDELDTAAGAAAVAAAKAEDSAADLGENLLPIYTKLADTLGVVADGFGALPEPVQTALIVLAGVGALYGPVKTTTEALGTLATLARTKLASSLETAAIRGLYLKDNLGRIAIGAGALGVALTGAALLFEQYSKAKADAADREQSYTTILNEQTDAVNENLAAHAGAKLLTGELGEALREAGASVSVFTDAITNSDRDLDLSGKTIAALRGGVADLDDVLGQIDPGPLRDELVRLAESTDLSDGQILELINRLAEEEVALKNSTRESKNKAEADKEAGVEAGTAAGKTADHADSLGIEEQAAKDAADAMDAFREAVERAMRPLTGEEAVDRRAQDLADLAADIEERRRAVEDARQKIADLKAIKREDRPDDFARQMADAQADLQAAIDATSLALTGNSDAALRNREQVRGLIDDSVGIIEAARDEGKSLEDLKATRDLEIENLRTQLEQMGFNRQEIERYIDVIEDIPLTRATTLDVETATAEAKLKAWRDRMNREIQLNPFSVDVLQSEKFAAGPRGHAAGGFPFDGDFVVGETGKELLRKRGADLEVIAGPVPSALGGGGGDMARVEALLAAILAEARVTSGNTAGPTTTQRLRRVQTMAGVI